MMKSVKAVFTAILFTVLLSLPDSASAQTLIYDNKFNQSTVAEGAWYTDLNTTIWGPLLVEGTDGHPVVWNPSISSGSPFTTDIYGPNNITLNIYQGVRTLVVDYVDGSATKYIVRCKYASRNDGYGGDSFNLCALVDGDDESAIVTSTTVSSIPDDGVWRVATLTYWVNSADDGLPLKVWVTSNASQISIGRIWVELVE